MCPPPLLRRASSVDHDDAVDMIVGIARVGGSR
jgi:hypothetical protein